MKNKSGINEIKFNQPPFCFSSNNTDNLLFILVLFLYFHKERVFLHFVFVHTFICMKSILYRMKIAKDIHFNIDIRLIKEHLEISEYLESILHVVFLVIIHTFRFLMAIVTLVSNAFDLII